MPEFKDELTPGPEESLSLELNSQAEVPHVTKFDRFRLSQDFHEYAGVKKLLTTVPVKKTEQATVCPDETRGGVCLGCVAFGVW